jgi:GNAT superfamily N-acetyltransferase
VTYEFRHFDLDRDIRPYIELCREVLAVEFSWELLSWKNRDVRNPDRPPKIYLAIGEEGDIAGAISFFPMHLKFRGADYFAALAGDVMVAHRHRRKGLFKRLIAYGEVELERIGCRLIYGFPNVAAHPLHGDQLLPAIAVEEPRCKESTGPRRRRSNP